MGINTKYQLVTSLGSITYSAFELKVTTNYNVWTRIGYRWIASAASGVIVDRFVIGSN
jgi:hypothetical protein